MNWRAKFLSSTRSKSSERQRRDAEPGQVLDHGRAEPAGSEDDDVRVDQPHLDLLAVALQGRERVEEGEVAEVALALVVAQATGRGGVLQPAQTVQQLERRVDVATARRPGRCSAECGVQLGGRPVSLAEERQQRPHLAAAGRRARPACGDRG